jgi:hypothetical protein
MRPKDAPAPRPAETRHELIERFRRSQGRPAALVASTLCREMRIKIRLGGDFVYLARVQETSGPPRIVNL